MINKIKQLKKTSIIISLVFIQSCALNLNTYDFETDSLESFNLAGMQVRAITKVSRRLMLDLYI